MATRRIQITTIIVLTFLGAPAIAQLNSIDWRESFNYVSVTDGNNSDGGGISSAWLSFDDRVELDESAIATRLVGFADASGSADPTSLKLSIEISGSISNLHGNALANEWYTISDPNAAPGSLGTMYLNYRLGGAFSMDGINSDGRRLARAGFQVTTGRRFMGDPTEIVIGEAAKDFYGSNAGGPGSGGSLPTMVVPFTYDVPFNVTSALGLLVNTDGVFQSVPPRFIDLVKISGTVDRVKADFGNSADLETIFIPDGASLSVASGIDLASRLRFGIPPAPVPVPGVVWLFGAGLFGILARRRR